MMNEERNRIVFDVTRLQLSEIMVFFDRADIQRRIEFSVERAGRVDLLVENMAPAIDAGSIRLECCDEAKILETWTANRNELEDPVRRARVDEMREAQKELMKKEQAIADELHQAKEVRAMFKNTLQAQSNQQPLDNVVKFLTRGMESLKKMDDDMEKVKSRLIKLREDIEVVRKEVESVKTPKPRCSILIRLEVEKPGKIEMMLMYAVNSVSWSAAYAVQIDSNKRLMKLMYHGLVRQKSGEDWSHVDIRLISARYGVESGQVPKLGVWKVIVADEKKLFATTVATSAVTTTESGSSAALTPTSAIGTQDQSSPASNDDKSVDVELDNDEDMRNCTFQAFCESIPSDGEEHQVLLLSHNIPVELFYECIPRRAQFAFVKAKALNCTSYPLLPGRLTAYMDNSLVAYSSFSKIINVRERFEFALGADPAVRIDYRENANTFSAQLLGYFSRPTTSTTFDQRTIITNRRNAPIVLRLIDMVPNSADDGVLVQLLEPRKELLSKQTSGVIHDKEGGCLIWDVFVGPGKDVKVSTKYSVQYPTGKMIKMTASTSAL